MWRRNNSSLEKVSCNKCGLFERTHSRPRPEQFPHFVVPFLACFASSCSRANGPLRFLP
ncbi:hypothetical protein B0H14DRAFT_3077671 [Mycena olivaceomarginata]|nr:hypothetical protein B0H14DRAFT_3077671 [Mycena olivaceomarginata]